MNTDLQKSFVTYYLESLHERTRQEKNGAKWGLDWVIYNLGFALFGKPVRLPFIRGATGEYAKTKSEAEFGVDVAFLSEALIAYFRQGTTAGLDEYSGRALGRVWKAERFSWWFTSLTHRFPDMDPFARKMQMAELEYIFSSRAAQVTVAENYVGLPMNLRHA